MKARDVLWELPKEALDEFIDDGAFRFGAALSFYTILSLAPLLVVLLTVTSVFSETQVVREELFRQVNALIGSAGVETLDALLLHAERSSERGLVNLPNTLGIIVLAFGATAVFVQMQQALNQLWGVKAAPGKTLLKVLLNRLVCFGFVLAVGFLLLLSVLVTTVMSIFSNLMVVRFLETFWLWKALDVSTSFFVTMILFALICQYLPDASIAWRDLCIGACVTSLLFTLGKELIGYYLAHSALASVYGAAGSLVVLLAWVYYSSLIFLWGAELTQVYARRFGSGIYPRSFAVLVKTVK